MALSLNTIHLLCIVPMIILMMPPSSRCMSVPTAFPAGKPFRIVINNETYYEIGNISHPRKTTPRPLPYCRNVTLHQKAYTIFENGSLRIEVLNMTLNSSSSYRRSSTGLVTACIPSDPAQDYVKAVITSMVPPAVAGFALSFVSCQIRELRMCVCLLCMILYLVDFAIMFVTSLSSSGGQALDMQLRFLSLCSFFMIFLSSWMPLCTSAVIIQHLERLDVVSVAKGRVVVKRRTPLSVLVALLLTIILAVTLGSRIYPKVVHYTGYERSPKFVEEITRIPAVYTMAALNLVLAAFTRLVYGVKFFDPRLRYTKSYWMFFKSYACMLGLWTVGEGLGSYFLLDLSPIVFFMISVLMPLFIPHFEFTIKSNVLPDVLVMIETGKNLPEVVPEAQRPLA